jgi:hypothetical protein
VKGWGQELVRWDASIHASIFFDKISGQAMAQFGPNEVCLRIRAAYLLNVVASWTNIVLINRCLDTATRMISYW